MDRLYSLRKSEANSVASNTSINSELGYETAQDDSISSLYYSINDDSISNIAVTSPGPSGHQDVTILPDTDTASEPSPSSESFISAPLGTESSKQISIAEPIEIDPPTITSSTDDVAETNFESGPAILSMNREIVNHELNTIGMNAMATAQNLIFNLPPGPAHSSSDITNFAGSSSEVQEMYVVTVAQHRTTSTRASVLNRVARRTAVRFQDDEMPRRTEMVRRSEMPRKSEMSSRTMVSLVSRRSQAMATIAETKPVSRRTLMERNIETRPEPSRKDNHICDVCRKAFPLRSTLIVHKSSHKTECKYCDKTFKKALALSIHLKENCDKIPLAVRRKILAKEFKNVNTKV